MTGADDAMAGLAITCSTSVGGGDPREVLSTTPASRPTDYAAALHELSERLTAATNYLASGFRLSERASVATADAAQLTETLGKALGQLNLADDIAILLRKLLSEGRQ